VSRVIAIDVGAGTADILIRDDSESPENSVKLVVPSQTQVVAARLREATRREAAVVFSGPTMGGGADTRAMKAHTAAGLPFLATETAARSFSDDLDRVRARGVEIVGEDEAGRLAANGRLAPAGRGATGGARDLVCVTAGDVDAAGLARALQALGIERSFSAVAVAVQDHGFDPHGSNRVLRFALWEQAVRAARSLRELFYWADAGADRASDGVERSDSAGPGPEAALPRPDRPRCGIPPALTRVQAAVACAAHLAGGSVPLLAGDTGPAALLGALADTDAAAAASGDGGHAVLVNVGNGHTIAAVALDGRLVGVYEHHTGLLDQARLARQLRRFLAGDLDAAEVREDGGHGAVLAHPVPFPPAILVTGPNRQLLRDSGLPVRHPAPWGDMMIAGAVGLVRAMGGQRGDAGVLACE
jgi:uncharacterized protein (DUF1786 family)